MRRISLIPVGALTLGLLINASTVAAQESTAGLVSSLDVKRLIASGEPADHARLRDHFTALAARYDADARRHESMGRALTGNPIRGGGANLSAHCTRLAKLA